ncbi:hypothetical protein DPEC_G00180690 [Dallia pectoralis]|uniref:Uncharacterized protein n=1 Tax=Dallia pectoralis TaxID=75939 RepID=A0ACC2GAB2_DALPE|nr:hypothetical protein DPEC_G00180690 [Dallia pectoralis]
MFSFDEEMWKRICETRLEHTSDGAEIQPRKVIHEEEVSKIKAEGDHFDQTRKILDFVTAKGEAACYEFLMILDITRKRTLNDPELEQWISCFPFREDLEMTDYIVGPKPCQKYQAQLKDKARKITECAWKQSCGLLPESCRKEVTLSYTPLVLDTDVRSSDSILKIKSKKYKKTRPKKIKSFIPTAKQETLPVDLLKTHNKKILLVGKPGIGKTSVTHQMLKLWSEKDHRELDYLFYLDLGDISHSKQSLEDLLFNVYSEPKESRKEVLVDITSNSENVIIIFDGIADPSSLSIVKDIVEKLPEAKIVITSRPEESEDFMMDLSTDWFRVEVKGFSDESIRSYLTKMLSSHPDSLISVLNNLELFSLCHVPMYAQMVVACIYYNNSQASKQSWTTTKMYINILRHCIQKHSGKKQKDPEILIKNREKILSLAEMAFEATQEKTMNLSKLSCNVRNVQFAFLGALIIDVEPTASDTYSAFLHYTMQEFFGALWLLQNPDKISEVLQNCMTEDGKPIKHLIPYLCGLLNASNIRLVDVLVPAEQINEMRGWFFKDLVDSFLLPQTNHDLADGGPAEFETNVLFLCQCMYESQSTDACLLLLEKLEYKLDLSGEHLDPHHCCAVSYVINQSLEKKVDLNLDNCTVSDQGLRLILGALKNVSSLGSEPSLLCEFWITLLQSEAEMDFTSLLVLCGNDLHLPVQGESRVFERAEEVMKKSLERVNLCLHWDQKTNLSESLSKSILECLPNINKLCFASLKDQRGSSEMLDEEEKRVLLHLCRKAGLYQRETFQRAVNNLLSMFSMYQTERYDILLDLYSYVKDKVNQTGRSVLALLKPLYQPAPAVWYIDLSKRKTSVLLEVLKLQPEKKLVELKDWSDEESEVRCFLQCLPYISQLSFSTQPDSIGSPEVRREKTFLLNLCLQTALHDRENLQTTIEKVLSLTNKYYNEKLDFLLDLYSHVKDYETQRGRSVLPALQPVYQSAPAVWYIDLSERKTSVLLEVLKLQPEKKLVELKDWSDEESEVRCFLQCLPYISQLRFYPDVSKLSDQIKFLVDLLSQAAEWEEQTGETTLNLVSSVCTYSTFPFHKEGIPKQSDILLDLYSHVKDYETQTGRSVLPALQPVYQSAPAVWYIYLSKRKTSVLLEVLKLQPEKKPVELKGWSDEESEVRCFLQCLPYISQLNFSAQPDSIGSPEVKREKIFLLNLCLQAALHDRENLQTTIEKVWSLSIKYYNEKLDFLLDLYSHVKDYETQTGRSVLPALQPVYQSAPAVWYIDLSERKTSVLLEVLKLQPEKKPVVLKRWLYEESEVRCFLQCLPYISQLRFYPDVSKLSDQIKFLVDLLSQAAEWEEQTGETTLNLVSSVCTYSTFPFHKEGIPKQSDILLDLYSHVKDYETQTGRSVLPALQPVYQSAPAVWYIYLSKRKTSVLLEVLKLQPEKKPVELKGWSDEESEVRCFLQCLPYISQLNFSAQPDSIGSPEVKREKIFLLNLCLQAALHDRENLQTTIEKVWSLSIKYYNEKLDFLLDLYSHVKDYETQTGRSVLPALQPVYQSAPAVWYIDLSERKTSVLLEVLKLQPEKKPVVLKRWLYEESEVRCFLQCLPYISQLRFDPYVSKLSDQIKFLVDLLSQAAEWEEQTGETTLNLVSSVCTYSTFPFSDDYFDDNRFYQSDFLLDLYSHVKDYETQTGRSVLPALQPVYQSAPAVWYIDLSERKTSVLLEVLKLQPEKKPVVLKRWLYEESEVRCFLQCLPYISQLRFDPYVSKLSDQIKFLVDLLSQAAEWEEQTGETTLNLVSSVCTYSTFPFHKEGIPKQSDILLDLYSHVKDYETQTGRSVLPALQPVYQSAPAVWSIDLSERKTSVLLEVLKLQPEKKLVELKGWSDEESEVRSFLQCLPYISQLRFCAYDSDLSKQVKFLVDLLSQAAVWEEQTGETTLNLVSSVCTFSTFPFHKEGITKQSDFLLDLYSHVKDYETQTGRSVLPALQSVYQSASPAVWYIDLSERKTSVLLEVLKLQPEKKPVVLKRWLYEESEVRCFLQCLPYISQLRFDPYVSKLSDQIKFLVDLLSQAAEWEEQTGETTLNLVSSVCTYSTFPFHFENNSKQSDILLDLYSHVKDYETQTGRSVLPALQPVYQSAPAVWSIDLSERKTSVLLEVLKLQPEKKPVELKGWSDEESEVRCFLQCLPYISQLSCDDEMFFQRVCESIPVSSREDSQLLVSLLQALGSTLSLGGHLPRKTCRSVGRVLGLCPSSVDLTLTPRKISVQGTRLLLSKGCRLHKLRLSVVMAVKLSRVFRRTGRGFIPLTVPELSLVPDSRQTSERQLSRALSSVAFLLRVWTVHSLDLTDFCFQGHSVILLLSHQGPLTLRLQSDTLQKLVVTVFIAQDEDLTQRFLEKVGGDLTSCRLDWEVFYSLLQNSTHNITVDLRKNRLLEKNISVLLPFLRRIVFKRPSSSFLMSTIREIYERRDSVSVSSLLRSSDRWINLSSRELDRVDCASLCYTLQHSHQVKVNLLWTSLPPEAIESILRLLDRVSLLSVDRKLLLSFLQCCTASPIQQEALPLTAVWLLRALNHRLDFSCSSALDLSADDQGEALCLTTDHCRAITAVLEQSGHITELVKDPTKTQTRKRTRNQSQTDAQPQLKKLKLTAHQTHTQSQVQPRVQLNLRDCEVEDEALRELFPVLHCVKLSLSKVQLLQLVDLVCEGGEEEILRHTESLVRALDEEIDLSETRLDQKTCRSLALVLEHSERLTELDLSHCQLTDQHLDILITHLNKVQVLDLSHNYLTDTLTNRIVQLVSTNPSIQTVRLNNNRIQDRRPFLKDPRFEIW